MSLGNRSYFALYRLRLLKHAEMPQATATAVNVTKTENEAIAADARGPAQAQSQHRHLDSFFCLLSCEIIACSDVLVRYKQQTVCPRSDLSSLPHADSSRSTDLGMSG